MASALPAPDRSAPRLLGRVGWNTAWLGLARLVTQGQLAILTILAARSLGVSAFGEYATITTVVVIGNVLTTFGTDTLLIREVARDRAGRERWASAALALQLGLSLIILGVALACAGTLPSLGADAQMGLRLYAAAWIPLAFFSVYTALLRGYQRMDLYLLANLILVTFQTAGAYAVLRLSPGLVPLLAWLLVTQAAGAAIAAGFARAAGFTGFGSSGWDTRLLRQVLRLAWPLGVISLVGILYQRMGVLALSLSAPSVAVGWFAAAARIIEAGKLVHVAILGALLPALAGLSGSAARGSEVRLFRQATLFLLGLSGLAAVFLAVVAAPLIALLLGGRYLPAAPLLAIMGVSLIPYTVSACLSVWEVVHNRERRLLWVILVSTALALGAYLLLIHALGVIGAAWATVASETLQMAVFLAVLLIPSGRWRSR